MSFSHWQWKRNAYTGSEGIKGKIVLHKYYHNLQCLWCVVRTLQIVSFVALSIHTHILSWQHCDSSMSTCASSVLIFILYMYVCMDRQSKIIMPLARAVIGARTQKQSRNVYLYIYCLIYSFKEILHSRIYLCIHLFNFNLNGIPYSRVLSYWIMNSYQVNQVN